MAWTAHDNNGVVKSRDDMLSATASCNIAFLLSCAFFLIVMPSVVLRTHVILHLPMVIDVALMQMKDVEDAVSAIIPPPLSAFMASLLDSKI
eukprot:143257-Ditylum_brightwellii.AAC.1